MPVVNTQRLFAGLLPGMQITCVCDVGSMDGRDALRFRSALPHAVVLAFEPHPRNLAELQSNPVMQKRNVEIVPLAASNLDAEADFYLVGAGTSRSDVRRGMSSLQRRSGEFAPEAVVSVKTARLDTYLADRCGAGARLALWIDVEGHAFEVIEGMAGVTPHVQLIHVAVEKEPSMGCAHRLYPEVKLLLQGLGFVECAIDQPRGVGRFNALFVRRELPALAWWRLRMSLLGAWLRRRAVGVVRRICPGGLREDQR